MLSRVLLHVVEATLPVDDSVEAFTLRLAGEEVSDRFAFVHDFDDGDAT